MLFPPKFPRDSPDELPYWLMDIPRQHKYTIAVELHEFLEEGRSQEAYHFVYTVISNVLLRAWIEEDQQRFAANPAEFILRESSSLLSGLEMEDFIGAAIWGKILDHETLGSQGFPVIPHLPFDEEHFTLEERIHRINLIIDTQVRYNSARLEYDTSVFDLLDAVHPGERDFTSCRALLKRDKTRCFTDGCQEEFEPRQGMLGYMSPEVYGPRILDYSWPYKMPGGRNGLTELMRSWARTIGVQVESRRFREPRLGFHPNHFIPPNQPCREAYIDARHTPEFRANSSIHDCQKSPIGWFGESEPQLVATCMAAVAASGYIINEGQLCGDYGYKDGDYIWMCPEQIDPSYHTLYIIRNRYAFGDVHDRAKADIRTPSGLLSSVVEIRQARLDSDTKDRQLDEQDYQQFCAEWGDGPGCSRVWCDFHVGTVDCTGIGDGMYAEDPIAKALNPDHLAGPPTMVCRRCLVITELLMRSPENGGLGLSPYVAEVLQYHRHQELLLNTLRLYGCWVRNCRFARIPGLQVQPDPLNVVPFVCGDCAEHRQDTMQPAIEDSVPSRLPPNCHIFVGEVEDNTQTFVKCSENGCPADAIDPETTAGFVRSESSTYGFVINDEDLLCGFCMRSGYCYAIGRERVEYSAVSSNHLDWAVYRYLDIKRRGTSGQQLHKAFWRFVKPLCAEGIIPDETVGCDLARKVFLRRLRTIKRHELKRISTYMRKKRNFKSQRARWLEQ